MLLTPEDRLKDFAETYLNDNVKWEIGIGGYGDSGMAVVAPHPSNPKFTLYIEDNPDEHKDDLGDFNIFVEYMNDEILDEHPDLDYYQVFIYITDNEYKQNGIFRSNYNVSPDTSHFSEFISDEGWDEEMLNGETIEEIWF